MLLSQTLDLSRQATEVFESDCAGTDLHVPYCKTERDLRHASQNKSMVVSSKGHVISSIAMVKVPSDLMQIPSETECHCNREIRWWLGGEDFQVLQILTAPIDVIRYRAVSATRETAGCETSAKRRMKRDPVFLTLPLVGCSSSNLTERASVRMRCSHVCRPAMMMAWHSQEGAGAQSCTSDFVHVLDATVDSGHGDHGKPL